MAKQVINIGSAELAGDGETLRSALNKVNLNFTELYNDDADFETQFNTHVNTATAGTDHILSWNGSDFAWRPDNDTIGIQYTDLSVNFVEGAAVGDGSLTYNQGNGVFQYSPPKLNGLIADGTTDFGANKITYSNMYASLVDLPDAVQYHGMFAHVHATGKAYFAHGGNWVELASQTDIIGTFGGLAGTPTTIAGYGITDAFDSTTSEVAIGSSATAGLEAVSIGKNAGDSGDYSQAIGNNAGNTGQGVAAVALGSQSGETSQGNKAVAVGQYAGQTSQGADATAIGAGAGKTSQGGYATAIGVDAGQISQSAGGVAIGRSAGYSTQGLSGIAIGYLAGESNQGAEAIAIGANAGTANQAANSIILNAAGATLQNTQASSFVVKPVRNASGTHSLEYNPTTGEVTYDTLGGGAADTDAIPEGTTNLYYTDARADARAQLKVDALVDTAPGTMDTLNELAAALGDDANFATTTATSIAEKLPLAGGTMTGAIDMGSNNITTTGKMLFANMYATEGDLPSATTYHGMFAHVHGTGAGYFAHGGNWVKLANHADIPSGGLANVVEDTTPQLGGDLDCQGFNITMDNGIISTSAGNLQLSSFNYVTIDSANDGQIEIGRSSGTGDVIIGKESNGTSVSFEGVASFNEQVLMYKGAEEKYSALTGATGTVAHDCDNGKMFYHTTPAADWTANFTNLNLNQFKFSTSVGIVVTQGGTAYIPNAVEIGGVAQTIIWQGNSTPTGTANGTDAISFTIMRDGSTYIVLGQLTSFGGV